MNIFARSIVTLAHVVQSCGKLLMTSLLALTGRKLPVKHQLAILTFLLEYKSEIKTITNIPIVVWN